MAYQRRSDKHGAAQALITLFKSIALYTGPNPTDLHCTVRQWHAPPIFSKCTSVHVYTVEPLYNGHLWWTMFWPLYRGGLC